MKAAKAARLFDRHATQSINTQAYRRFKLHHTEINDLYWSFVPIASYADYLARHAPTNATPVGLFHASGPDSRRLPSTVAEWTRIFGEFQNWTRLSSLLSMVSYFEIYLRDVITIALRSDPLVRFGSPKLLDGLVWIKRNVSDDLEPIIRPCIVGEWPSRFSQYKALFGRAPSKLQDNIGELEKIRILRNGVGHAFGRNIRNEEHPLSTEAGTSERLSELQFKQWLGLIDEIAAAIDKHLSQSHIGEFELLWRLHLWLALPRDKQEPKYDKVVSFAREMHRVNTSNRLDRKFYRDLMAYYNSV